MRVFLVTFSLVPLFMRTALGDVITSEFSGDPVAEGWTVASQWCDPIAWQQDGTWNQELNDEACPGAETGATDAFTRSAEAHNGVAAWFFEYRVFTNGDRSEIPGVAPANVASGNGFGLLYHSTVANDRVKLFRDAQLPVVFVDLEPNAFHTIRLELLNNEPPTYHWFADAVLVDSGLAEGAYPANDASVTWLGRSWQLPTFNQWDYVRFGTIPVPSSADFNSDSLVDEFEVFYIAECIDRSAAGEPAVPSCSWADVNADNIVDCTDWEIIETTLWTSPNDAPPMYHCVGAVPATSEWGVAVMALFVATCGTLVFRRRRHLAASPAA